MYTTLTQPEPFRPEEIWRFPCRVNGGLVVTGDLPYDPAEARELLDRWVELGVTHIVDVRGEHSDAKFVAEHAPHITYVWAGTHDAGGRQSGAWFDEVLDALGGALADPDAVVLVHCHMGVNRGPSMALRLMLEQGYDAIGALDAIRAARPIAAVLYAEDAVDHYHRAIGSPDTVRYTERRKIRAWLVDNAIDTAWIISNIRRAE